MKKWCSKCKKEKPTSEFAEAKGRYDGLQTYCIPCKKEYGKDHYNKNRKVYLSRSKNQRKAAQEYVDNLKRKPCADCGQNFPSCVMDFDHVRGKKEFNIATGLRFKGIQQILAEVAKCDVVCSNCHRIRTHGRK